MSTFEIQDEHCPVGRTQPNTTQDGFSDESSCSASRRAVGIAEVGSAALSRPLVTAPVPIQAICSIGGIHVTGVAATRVGVSRDFRPSPRQPHEVCAVGLTESDGAGYCIN